MTTKNKELTKILLIVFPMVLFILIAIFVGADIATGFESWAYKASVEHMSPLLTNVIVFITHLGDPVTVAVICLALFVLPKFRRNYAIPVSTAVIIATILNLLLKQIFMRERPDILQLITETTYSFPSGHAMINAALYATLAVLVWKYVKNRRTKILTAAISAAIVLAICFSRVYLGVHYITDVIAGLCLGLAIAVITSTTFIRHRRK